MGYTTEYQGVLKFTSELSGKELAYLKKILGEDCRDHPEWAEGFPAHKNLYYVQFQLTDDFDGIEWDGSEKFNEAVSCVNLITTLMKKIKPDFGFTGVLQAQGENFDDRWLLKISSSGRAYKEEVALAGKIVECPHCDRKFELVGE